MATNAPTDPIERYMTEYRGMKADNAESTFRKHRSNLQRFREQLDKPLLDVTAVEVRYWINDKRADGMADTTVMGYKASLSRFYRRAKVNDWIETNPVEEVVWDDYDLSKKSQKQKESPDSDRIQPLTKSEVNASVMNYLSD
jgi:site-specific recombinase XerD